MRAAALQGVKFTAAQKGRARTACLAVRA